MDPVLLDSSWRAKGDERRLALSEAFLRVEPSEYAAIIGMPLDIHGLAYSWILLLQGKRASYVEQVHFGEVHCWPLPERETHYWNLRLRGFYTKQLVKQLGSLGVWDAIEEPVSTEELLDGLWANILIKHPGMPICKACTCHGAIYESGARGSSIIECVAPISRQSKKQFTQSARTRFPFSKTA